MGGTTSIHAPDTNLVSPSPADEPDIDEANHLYFPPEILAKIVLHLTPRDKLVAKQVCHGWNDFITFGSNLKSEVVMIIEDSENNLAALGNSPFPSVWTDYVLRNLDLSKKSARFWSINGDHITKLSLVDCAASDLTLNVTNGLSYCNSLRHVSLRNCNKYFMMGNKFVQIHKFLNLEKLERLDLSCNSYLNDRILFSFLVKTKCLKSLNLSDCPMTFANSVFQRFYPARNGPQQIVLHPDDCSDYILSFQMLHIGFLVENNLNEIILNRTSIDKITLKTLSNSQFNWASIGLNRCNEIKEVHIVEFLQTQNQLQKLKLEKLRITENLFQFGNLAFLKYLVMRECTEIKSLEFMKALKNLEHLDISYCTGIKFETGQDCLSSAPNLRVLKLRGIVPFYIHDHTDQSSVSRMFAEEFGSLHKMIELDIGACGSIMSDSVLQSITKNMLRIQKLWICKSPVTDAGLSELRSLAGLRVLSLAQCEAIGERTWAHAIRFHSLSYLDLSRCLNLSKNGLLEIVNQCRSLEELIVTNSIRVSCESQARFNIDGDEQLLKFVNGLPRLRKFVLSPIS